jgi:GntR family transcriptional repressor for pyruvate dehydrogenase complex
MSAGVAIDFSPVRSEPAYRIVARMIEAKILAREWPVGVGLPSESALAESLGVNRSTLRESIRVLEETGLVRRRLGGKQLFVSAPRHADIAARVTAAMVLQEMTFLELWEGMHCLEPALAEAAASRIEPDEISALEDNLARTREALAERARLVELDIEFHDIIARASRNRALQLCREPISQLFYPAFLGVFSRLNAGERLLFAHERILAALRAGDVADARAWMDKHIADFRRGYELANLDIGGPVRWPEGGRIASGEAQGTSAS